MMIESISDIYTYYTLFFFSEFESCDVVTCGTMLSPAMSLTCPFQFLIHTSLRIPIMSYLQPSEEWLPRCCPTTNFRSPLRSLSTSYCWLEASSPPAMFQLVDSLLKEIPGEYQTKASTFFSNSYGFASAPVCGMGNAHCFFGMHQLSFMPSFRLSYSPQVGHFGSYGNHDLGIVAHRFRLAYLLTR